MDKYEQEAREIVEELTNNSEVIDVWIGDIDVHYAEVCVLYGRRRLPMGFLQFVGEYGDLYVEGTDGDKVELTIQL